MTVSEEASNYLSIRASNKLFFISDNNEEIIPNYETLIIISKKLYKYFKNNSFEDMVFKDYIDEIWFRITLSIPNCVRNEIL